MSRACAGFSLLAVAVGILCCLTLCLGPARLDISEVFLAICGEGDRIAREVVWQIRIPQMGAAVLSGASLAVAGLVLQSVFKNPLAGPFVLGVSSGANLGVALVLLAGFGGTWGIVPCAAAGAFAVVLLVLFASRFVARSVSLLIVGLMLGYFVDAIVSFLMATSSSEALKGFVTWGLGSFSRLSLSELPVFLAVTVSGLFLCALSVRYLNAAQVGDDFAKSLGVNVRLFRVVALFGASLLSAGSTVYCGPIGFLGLASPHIAFGIFRTSNHRVLMPAAALVGILLALLSGAVRGIPLSCVTSLFGAPIVLWVFLRNRRGEDA